MVPKMPHEFGLRYRRQRVSMTLLRVLLYIAVLRPPLHAQQENPPNLAKLSLEQLMDIEVATVNGASKFDQKVTSAPSYVTVITAEEIQKYGYRTLADVLESVPGFYVNNDRNYSYLGVRGFGRPGDYNDRILLLIDGHRLNGGVYGDALIGTEFPLDIDLIQRVEIIRGPGSALYGTNAFFGVINVITKRGRDLQGAEVSAAAGSLGTYSGRATFGNQWHNGPELLLSGTFYNSHGNNSLFFPEFNAPATNNGLAVNDDGDQFYNVFGSLKFHDFTFQGAYGSRTKVIPTASFGTVFNDSRSRTTDAVGYFDLKYEHQFGANWDVLARIGYDHDDYHGTYVVDYAGMGIPPYTLNQDFGSGERVTPALDVSKTFFEKHRITLGTEIQVNLKQDQSNYDQTPYVLYLDDRRSSTVPAVYIQDEFSILKNLTLSAGVRWDHYGQFGNTENPRLGLIYSPRETTTLKLLYGSAFRAPNDYELYYTAATGFESNPFLRPEKIKTTELVFEQYFAKYAYVDIAGFYNDIRDLISEQTNTNGLISFANVNSVYGKGVDFELAGRWPGGLLGRISYTLQESRDRLTGATISDSPKNLAKLNLSAPVIRRWLFASMEGQYRGPVGTLAGAQIGGFFIANATVSSAVLLHSLSISASAYNLFNRKYSDPAGNELKQDSITQDGRTVRLRLTYQFGSRQ